MTPCTYFSIIVPTYNRPRQLQNCLAAISALEYPRTCFEVLIIDDGGEATLEAITDEFTEQFNLRLWRKPNEGPASARNFGAARARGEYLAFMDDDCLPDPGWLTRMAKQIQLTPHALLGGQTVNNLENNLFACASQLIVKMVYEHFNADPQNARFFASNNMVIPRRLFNEAGKFVEGWRTSEDRELCDRWLMQGNQMSFVEEAVIYHAHDLDFWGFCKQHFGYGKGAFHYHRLRKIRASGTILQEMDFHANLKNWLLAPFFKREKNPVLVFALLIIWQIINVTGFVWAACFEKRNYPLF